MKGDTEMNTLIAILEVALFLFKVGVAIVLVLCFAWVGTMIWDEAKTEEGPFKIVLTAAIFLEYVFHGQFNQAFGRSAKKAAYKARHAFAEEFIDNLVVELRQVPGSLCYEDPFSEENIAKHYALAA
jgi:hypothetical protein